MPANLLASNLQVREAAQWLKEQLQVGHAVRLFTNDLPLTPALEVLDFAEATWPGYARWNLNAEFLAPIKLYDGGYAVRSVSHTFSCTGFTNEKAFGWYLLEGSLVKFCARFANPIQMGIGISFPMRVTIEVVDMFTYQG